MVAPPAAISTFLRRYICQHSAITVDQQNEYLLQARLAPLCEREGVRSWDELVQRLNAPNSPALRQRVIEAMATHETLFFRDWQPFEALRSQVLPRLATERAGGTIHIWSAAASSGQEIYSIAFLVAQQMALWNGNRPRLIATDLSSEILAKAREGRYSQLEVNRGLPAPFLVRFFDREGMDWRIKEEIRKTVEFRVLNLIEGWPALPAMDVVFLRNVLIYFDIPTRKRILDRVAEAMRPGGLLFLGGVESTLHLTDRFAEQKVGNATCHRRIR